MAMTPASHLYKDSHPHANDTAALSHPLVSAIHRYWDGKRGARSMPRRADLDPVELRGLVENIVLYDVVEGGYRVRLVGNAIVEFEGRNTTGEWAGSSRPPEVATQLIDILGSIVSQRTPRFRTGVVHWHRDRTYRQFESCFLPLSPDDSNVNMILNAIAFTNPTSTSKTISPT